MKKILIIFILGIVLMINAKAITPSIPEEAIRLRVIPNSNSVYDQEIKIKVRNLLQEKMYNLLKDTKGIENARDIVSNNINNIDKEIKQLLEAENYDLGYTINYGNNYFPKKEYKGITYEEGYYESLLVTLGKGEGDNWWCVLFPPLCLLEAEESDEVEYKFFIQELIEKYL